MKRFRRACPPVVNEQTYGEIGETDSVLVINSRVPWRRLDEDVIFLKLDRVAAERVLCLSQKRDLPECLWNLQRLPNPKGVDSNQLIPGSNTRIIAGPASGD